MRVGLVPYDERIRHITGRPVRKPNGLISARGKNYARLRLARS
jgi:hypothetical protein